MMSEGLAGAGLSLVPSSLLLLVSCTLLLYEFVPHSAAFLQALFAHNTLNGIWAETGLGTDHGAFVFHLKKTVCFRHLRRQSDRSKLNG